jgi:hypothetical protein
MFKQLVDSNGFHGHTTYVLHDPTLPAVKTPAPSTEGGPARSGLPDTDIDDNGMKLTAGGKPENTGNNSGTSGEHPGTSNDPGVGPGVGPIDPNTVDATNLSDADARALYMDLTGKSPDGRWSVEKLKEKIAEIQGKV